MSYWRYEKARKRFKFRCRLYTKKGEKEGSVVKPIISAIKAKKSFKKIYNKRTSIERLFGLLKKVYKLGELRFKGLKNVSFHVLMSFIAYLGRAIAGIKMKTRFLPV